MKYDPDKHHRRSIRLNSYDYRQSGAYFITVCTRDRKCFFGAVAGGEMQLNDAGEMVNSAWQELPSRFPSVCLDAFTVMPNHIHGIIFVGAQFIAPESNLDMKIQGVMNHAPTLGKIIRVYKATSTLLIRRKATPEFAWQRNYYEHVVRDEKSLNRIRQYILTNPARWDLDRENPAATTPEAVDIWRV
ncbi:MAG TPA: transposase [Candidatus Binatia bacterium]|jgi:REP element-mobilizing transposase RayT